MLIQYRGKYRKFKNLGYGFSMALKTLEEEYKKFSTVLVIEEHAIAHCLNKGLDKENFITIDPEKDFNAKWKNPHLSTLARQRTQLISKKKDLALEYRKFISLMITISHEVGHLKHHHKRGKRLIDFKKYKSDLEYRIQIEKEAEQETTRIAKKYGFYEIINNIELV